MTNTAEIMSVDASNVAERGFFCYKSKPKSEGFRRKMEWVKQGFSEGLRIKLLCENGGPVGFIEYMPGETTWRAVQAADSMVIHCLWVVGRNKGKGYGKLLLNECIQDVRRAGLRGVAAVTGQTWLTDIKFLLHSGFVPVDQAPPLFELLALSFAEAHSPAFPKNWEERLGQWGDSLTIVRSDQCPYVDASTRAIQAAAGRLGIASQVIELKSAREAREIAPAAYGTFGVAYQGRLLSYRPMGEKDLLKALHQPANSRFV